MNGRRRKDEPFNPFAPNASQKSRERKERSPRPSRPKTPEPVKQSDDHAAKQRAAVEALKRKKELEEKKTAEKDAQNVSPVVRKNPSPQPKPAPKTSIKKPDSREDRLASLRAKSAATAQLAKDAKDEHEKKKAKAKAKAEAKAEAKAKAEANKLFEGRINMKQIQQVGDSGQYCSISGITCLEDVRIKVSKNKFKLLFDEKKNRSNWSGYDVTVTKNDPNEMEQEDSPYLLHCAPIET